MLWFGPAIRNATVSENSSRCGTTIGVILSRSLSSTAWSAASGRKSTFSNRRVVSRVRWSAEIRSCEASRTSNVMGAEDFATKIY
jgi:hypothetical protein